MKPLLIGEIKQATRAHARTAITEHLVGGVSTDSRTTRKGEVFFALRGEHFDGHAFIDQAVAAGAAVIVADRNVPVTPAMTEQGTVLLKVDDGIEALGNLAHAYREKLGKGLTVIAVTGSNGKTTTRRMIHHILSRTAKGHQAPANFNNHIGVPLTLLGVEADDNFVVVELGSNAPGEIAGLSRMAAPDIAVITHIGRSHLEKLGSVDGVSQEKIGIVTGLVDRGVVICPIQHGPTVERLRALRGDDHVITFSTDPASGAQITAQGIRRQDGRIRFMTQDRCAVDLPMIGIHNVSNALAALAVARRMGLSSQQVADALADFQPAEHRLNVHTVNGLTIIDDTYNANPDSMNAAMEELTHYPAKRRVVVAGDMGELGDGAQAMHEQLGRAIAALPCDLFFAAGPLMAHAAAAAVAAGMGWSRVHRAVSAKRVARLIKSELLVDDVVLVKGSHAMEMDKVVTSLMRFKGSRT